MERNFNIAHYDLFVYRSKTKSILSLKYLGLCNQNLSVEREVYLINKLEIQSKQLLSFNSSHANGIDHLYTRIMKFYLQINFTEINTVLRFSEILIGSLIYFGV